MEQHSVELTAVEARVVGSLIEKAFLTPDIYPMTTNSLVSACNQKTNREPVVSYDAVTIDGALLDLRQRNLVRRVHTPGSRSTKHRHTLDEALDLDTGALALMSVLLLRGAQTVGELRLRTERQHGFESIDEVEAALEALAGRSPALVVQLPRRPGQKEARWQHVIGDPDEVDAPSGHDSPLPDERVPATTASDADRRPSAPAPAADADLMRRVDELETEVAVLRARLATLAAALGESFDEPAPVVTTD